jgi:hypothetical protein
MLCRLRVQSVHSFSKNVTKLARSFYKPPVDEAKERALKESNNDIELANAYYNEKLLQKLNSEKFIQTILK